MGNLHAPGQLFILLASTHSGVLYSAPLAGGDDGPAQTIEMLRSLLDDAWKDPLVNRTAIEIIRSAGVQPYDSWGQIRAIYNWVRSNFYFVNDPVTKEALRPTRDLLELMAGDCDDINGNILPALLGTIGYETRLVTIAGDREYPDHYSHVYAEVLQDGKWYPLDAARPGAVLGMAPQYFFKRAWWSLTDGSHGDYPASAPAGAMAGYARSGVRGLNGWSTNIVSGLRIGSGVLQSINGQHVQPVLGQPVIGPGGAVTTAPVAVTPPSGSNDIAVMIGLGLLFWWLV